MISRFLIFGLLFLVQTITAQNFQTVEEVNNACATLGFSANEDAEIAVDKILDQIGLFRNFTIQECPNINNAIAKNITTSSGQKERYILYDNNFFNRIDDKAGSDWAAISILAHEIGHHLNGHSLNNEGSNHRFELEADYFSGISLAKMGASLEEAQSAIQTFRYEKATSTHPSKADRLLEIEKGWRKANAKKDLPEIKIIDPKFDIKTNDNNLEKSKEYLTLGYNEYEKNNYELASEYFLIAYQFNPTNQESLYYSASTSYLAKDYIPTINKFQKLLDLGFTGETTNLKVADIFKVMGLSYVALGEHKKALKVYADARKYDIDEYDLIVSEANMYLALDNKVKFREKMEEAILLRPNNPVLYFNLGVIYAEVDNVYKAEKYYKKAIALKPDYSDAYYNIAALVLEKENAIVNSMNEYIGDSKEDIERYDQLNEERFSIYREALHYLEKAYQFRVVGDVDKISTLNAVYEALGMEKRVD